MCVCVENVFRKVKAVPSSSHLQERRGLHSPRDVISGDLKEKSVYLKPCLRHTNAHTRCIRPHTHTHAQTHTHTHTHTTTASSLFFLSSLPFCFYQTTLNKSVMFAFYLLICNYDDVHDCCCPVQFYWET